MLIYSAKTRNNQPKRVINVKKTTYTIERSKNGNPLRQQRNVLEQTQTLANVAIYDGDSLFVPQKETTNGRLRCLLQPDYE